MVSDAVLIRSALPTDRAAMLDVTQDVWEGTDYVPFLWDTWLRDASGWLMVAEIERRVVALQHVARQPDGTGWVEGIRVADDMRGQGIGGKLLESAIVWARGQRCPRLRLSTSSGNPASRRIAERAGLTLLGDFATVSAGPSENRDGRARVAAPSEFGGVLALLMRTLPRDPAGWLYTEGWTAYTLSPERLRLLLGMAAVVVAGPGPDAVALVTMSVHRPSLRVGLIAGSADGCSAICRWLRRRAGAAGARSLRATVQVDGETRAVLEAEGFISRHGDSMLLHGLELGARESG